MAEQAEKLLAVFEARFSSLEKAAQKAQNDLTKNFRSIEQAGTRAEQNLSRIGPRATTGLANVGKAANDTGHKVQNLSFQFNDFFTQISSGTSVMQALSQQSGQAIQVLSGVGGLMGGLRLVGSAIINPMTLATVAVTTLAAVTASYFEDTSKDAEEANKKLEDHRRAIQDAINAWDGAPPQQLIAYNNEMDRLDKLGKQRLGLREFIQKELKPVEEAAADVTEQFEQLYARLEARNINASVLSDLRRDFDRLKTAVDSGNASVGDLLPLFTRLQELETDIGTTKGFTALKEAIQAMIPSLDAVNQKLKETRALERSLGQALEDRATRFREQDAFSPLPDTTDAPQRLGPDDFTERNGVRTAEETAGAVKDATDAFGSLNGEIDKFVANVVKAESGGNRFAKNPKSSATGLGQFIESTWLDQFQKNFPQEFSRMSRGQVLNLRTDPDISIQLIKSLASENAQLLRGFGVAVNQASLQLAHFLGPQGAAAIYNAAPGTRASAVLSPAAVAANPTILGGGATRESVIAYGQRRANAVDAINQQRDAVKNLGDAWDGLREKTAGANAALDQQQQAYAQLGNVATTVLDGIANALADGKIEGHELLQILLDVVKQILAMPPIPTAGTPAAGGGGGLGLIGTVLKWFGFAKGGIAKNGRPVRAFSAGGVSRQAAIFGEAGPEAAVPLPDGRQIPVDLRMPGRASGGMGGGSIELRVIGEPGPMFDAHVEAVSTDTSVRVTRQGIKQYDKKQAPSTAVRAMQQYQQRNGM